MFKKTKNFFIFIFLSILTVFSVNSASASSSPDETAFIFNTLLFLICGFLVMWMAAGFAMLESGMVRSKNVSTICLKNVGLYSISGIMFYIVGYNLAYGIPEGGYMGSFSSFVAAEDMATGYSAHSDWFFQMVFCATTVSIVSGTIAERIKIWPFFIFAAILAGIIYPIEMGWQWGGGWLSSMGFSDFAGSTLVHAAGGAAALAGAIIIGPRIGRFAADGTSTPIPASSIPLATLGTFILWLGWFGFNGGSQLAIGSMDDAVAVSNIFVNTNIAACSGLIVAMIISQTIYGKVDVTFALNGALAGLVSITAEPLMPTAYSSMLIGGIGGMIAVFGTQFISSLKIDDVVGALPVHLIAGIWGTIAVAITNPDTSFVTQTIGAFSVVIFVFILSAVVWSVLKMTIGVRPTEEEEQLGSDKSEVGIEAYTIQ
ncbi:ammonium transporter [bacterium]|jgi:Amt family ammonium transporter|nr:ammonium transporter [bacterium]NSX01648.1 ammonium transporter [Deltaproteobacteria bacterium TMED58]RZP15769.1 MAG: ammonium transporter [Candidatus Dadabacteria bacterium]|tara:strand:- start:20 stop:1306 length:1287 start_codon:yes stop_codon:yes gene_type:complete